MRETIYVVSSTNPLSEQCGAEVLAPEASDLLGIVLLSAEALSYLHSCDKCFTLPRLLVCPVLGLLGPLDERQDRRNDTL